jgi:hypothetical protein
MNFSIGDYVLISKTVSKDKLNPKWIGPYQIIDTISEHVFQVKNLLDNSVLEAHSSRIIFYSDSKLNVDANIKNYLINQQAEVYEVENILADRYTNEGKELLVAWKGFEEPSWEPEYVIQEDVPQLVEKYYKRK